MSISYHQAGTPRKDILRQLDDHIGVGDLASTSRWCDQYQKLCSDIGVVLAESDGDKAFTPQREGTIFGDPF